MSILELIKGYNSISIIGMDKNTGKTTTLNNILNEARGNLSLGLTSIGRDGEELDRVTSTEKPKIYVEKGSIIATAKQALFNSDITREILKTTGINTPMGEIVIARALSDGYIDLAGPSVGSYIAQMCKELKELGSEMVIVDGALSRKSFASPAITEATILSTGASLSRNMNSVVEQTVHTLNMLTLESIQDNEVVRIYREEMKSSRVVVIDKNYNAKTLTVLTALQAAKEIIESIDEDTKYVVIKGVISDKLLEDIIKGTNKFKGVTFIAEDGTKIFAGRDCMYKFSKMGGKLKVIDSINIACVTINPVSPYGYEFDKEKFLCALRERVSIPVFDVLGGEI